MATDVYAATTRSATVATAATRSATNEERPVPTHATSSLGRQTLLSQRGIQVCFLLNFRARPGPSVIEELLITSIDAGRTSGLHLYDSISLTVRGDGDGGQQRTRFAQIDFQQNVAKCFIFEKKRFEQKSVFRTIKL